MTEKNGWITDRLPTEEDADHKGYVIRLNCTRFLPTINHVPFELISIGEHWLNTYEWHKEKVLKQQADVDPWRALKAFQKTGHGEPFASCLFDLKAKLDDLLLYLLERTT